MTFCSFGDSCKFLHDRSDYKHGWQIEQESAEGVYGIDGDDNRYEISHNSSEDESFEDIPLVCMICRKDYKDPVVTICKHYFYSDCALKEYKMTARCYACTTDTKGFFKFAKNLLSRIAVLREKKKKHSDSCESDQEADHNSCLQSPVRSKEETNSENSCLNESIETGCTSLNKIHLPQSSEANWAKPEAPDRVFCRNMEDFYGVLKCTMNATEDEIKLLVSRARLKFHPDKNPGDSNREFMAVERAWSVLRYPERRKAYDALLKQHRIMSDSADLPVQCDVPFEKFDYECKPNDKVGVESDNHECHCYWFPCRCGGYYVLDDLSVLCKVSYAKCTDCSLLMTTKIDEEFELPSSPPPFKGSQEDRIETRKRQALFLRQALRIVERFARNPVNVTMLSHALPWLEREQYDDVSVERNAYGNCGYVLCCKPKGEISKQQYRICATTRKVYDITKRRPFCSDWCFRASFHIRKQISKEPAWCRPIESLKPCHINLLSHNASGHVGKVILDVPNRLLLTGSESDSSFENELSIDDESDSVDLSSSTLEHSRMELEKLALEMHTKNSPLVREICSSALNHVESTLHSDQRERDITSRSVSNQLLSDNQNSVTTNICDRLSKRLQGWLTEKALSVLTTYTFTSDESSSFDSLHKRILQQFYPKHGSSKRERNQEETQFSVSSLTCVLPLIDSVSPQVLRRQILLDSLKRSMHPILDALKVNGYCIYRRLETAVFYFNLTNKNVHMNPDESQLMALVFLCLMANVELPLTQLTNDECIAKFLNSMNGPSLLLFKNKIINEAMNLYSCDSDDEPASEL
ncbi:E3 ubiquitin-protein ligase [Schistosoma japonicum]|nr:E3 ubiquitin-protein ligase [Schistosoma japonicum]